MAEKKERKLIIFDNPDKNFHEKTNPDNLGQIPHPFQMILASSANSGKTNTILNIILNSDKPFEKIYIWHFDDESEEYNLIEHEKINEPPDIKMIDRKLKNLIILEDLDLNSLSKEQISKIDRFFGYVSTHKNLSIIATCQQEYSTPARLRRMMSHILLWRNSDPHFVSSMDKKILADKGKVANLLRSHCHERHDFLVFAFKETPMIRKNLFEAIDN